MELAECRLVLIEEVVLAADRAGIVVGLPFREGDDVPAGELLVQLRDEGPRAALLLAEKEAANDVDARYAEKAAEVARVEYERVMAANKQLPGAVPEVEVQKLKLAAEKAVLEIEVAKFKQELAGYRRDQARAECDGLQVAAPFAGTVTRVHRKRGEAVRQGDPILELASTRTLRVEGYIPLAHAWRVKRGQAMSVQLEPGDAPADVAQRQFPGRIVFVDLKAQPVTGVVRVWGEVDNPNGLLRAGLTARMTIAGQTATAAPVSSIGKK